MRKRMLSLMLALLTAVTLVIPAATTVSAAYENTYVNTGDQRADIIGVALTQVGYTEGYNNDTKYGDWYGLSNRPWCAMFVSWCARQAGVPTSVLKSTGLASPSAFGLSNTFTSSQRTPQPGDLFFKSGNSHVGLVYYVDGSYFYTLEGNTSTTTYDGTSVMSRKRKLSDFTFASPNYTSDTNHNYEKHYEDKHPHKVYYQCTDCSASYYTGDKATLDNCRECIEANCSHNYSSWEKSSDSQHKRTCSVCGKAQTESHDWTDTNIIREATCKEAGSKMQTCEDCGAQRTQTIDKTDDHDYGDWEFADDEGHKRVCALCETVDTEEHAIDEETEWSTDGKQHWYDCEVCAGKVKLADHAFGDDCIAPCDVCEYIREEGHFFSEAFENDGSEHWHACEKCDATSNREAHVFSAACDPTCDICGYERSVQHSFSKELLHDGVSHWYACTVCGLEKDREGHLPGPEATEEAAQCCTLCGLELAPKLEHVHEYTPVESDGTTHWGQCSCGEILEPEPHTWDVSSGSCSVCDACTVVPTTQQKNWDFIWIIGCGALFLIMLTTITVLIVKKKGAYSDGDPYDY